MSDPLKVFLGSLVAGQPPSSAPALLRAVWHGLHGEWDQAHEIAQEDETADGAWVHAWLHRIEGDAANAGYWYRRAGRPVAAGDTRREGETIAEAFLNR
ncbi:hypothetical protein [Arenibaculum pallidiluteum]|uniref:hypothetical protein n=1 Tax=Arenibaculum pallidiluteum TaxID=2812559 RepID=UPI001F36B0DD|nr:hypothetical protein [Arenibaculum pallidiluteum]